MVRYERFRRDLDNIQSGMTAEGKVAWLADIVAELVEVIEAQEKRIARLERGDHGEIQGETERPVGPDRSS